jgi:hypothetical protein
MIFNWRITDYTGDVASVALNADDPNSYGPVLVRGVRNLREELKQRLEQSLGAFGHSINLASSTPIDIDAALRALPYDVSIEGGESQLSTYDPMLPEGAIT